MIYNKHDDEVRRTGSISKKVVKEDGKEFIFDNHCNDITDSDEFYEWGDDDWEDWEWY